MRGSDPLEDSSIGVELVLGGLGAVVVEPLPFAALLGEQPFVRRLDLGLACEQPAHRLAVGHGDRRVESVVAWR